MAASSSTNLLLCMHSNFTRNPKIAYSKSKVSMTAVSSIRLCNPLYFQYKRQISPNPFTYHSVISSSLPSRKKISDILTERFVTFLLGSVIFIGGSFISMGYLRARPAVASPVSQESMGEKREVRTGESEDEDMCVNLLKQNPRDVGILKMVVNVKMKNGKTKEAVEYVEKLIEIQPNEMEWRLLQALCYEMMGHLSKAKKLFKDILKQRPLFLRALHGLAMVMHKNFEGPAVFEMLNEALAVAQREKRVVEERNIRILIGQMHLVKGELEEAFVDFQALINDNPRDFRPYLCQGIVYSLLDKKEEAREHFEMYQSLVPEEFPQRQYLDDIVLAAKTESRQQLEENFKAEFS